MAIDGYRFPLRLWSIFVVILITYFSSKYVSADVFASMADMEPLANAENEAVNLIQDYLKAEYARLNGLKGYAQEHATHLEQMRLNGSTSLAEPVNAYLTIKRLFWMNHLMNRSASADYVQRLTQLLRSQKSQPEENDKIGAAMALFRLQDTYRLETKDLADGLISGTRVAKPLTAKDCFELGKIAYESDDEDVYHTLLWMIEADRRLKNEKKPTVRRADVLEYMAYALYEQGNVERALDISIQLKKLDPKRLIGDHTIDDNIEYYKNQLINEGKDVDDLSIPPLKLERDISKKAPEFEQYERLCRGEIGLSPILESKLTCYYKINSPFLRLARLKVEVLHLKPKIVLLKEVISDSESEVVKKIARPKFFRAKVVRCSSVDEFQYVTAETRTSKIAWLKDTESSIVKRISKRVEDMTDLTTKTAEEMQISNYGIGGQYDTHYDSSEEDGAPGQRKLFDQLKSGNRIATVLFYLSQPTAGGATVFPEISLAVNASKNDAVFWYNLRPNGKVDKNLLHAGCPVLSGIKWVSNKWLHEYGQEFRRPCGLNIDDYE